MNIKRPGVQFSWSVLALPLHTLFCAVCRIAFEKVINHSGRNFPLGSTWAPETLRSGYRKRVGSAFCVPGLKQDSPKKEGEEKMVGALGP